MNHQPQLPPFANFTWWTLWAKWPRRRAERDYHPVICHLIDVASVAYALWSYALTPLQCARIADELRLTETAARHWVAFWAGLHDLGKVSPAFQTQLADRRDGPLIAQWLHDAGLPTHGARWAPHGAISLILLEDILPRVFHCGETLTRRVACVVGAHPA
jgi:CRISPR-associated endonuclease/helicase Cas3